MKILTKIIAIVALVALAACESGVPLSGDTGSAAAPGQANASTMVRLDGRGGSIAAKAAPSRYAVRSVEVTVPSSLTVSEANLFYPKADIVWRDEPVGDRYAQVKAVMAQGLAKGTANMRTGPPAVVAVRVERFHSLTEKARFSVGGVHNLVFVLTVRNAASGAILDGPRRVEVAIRASGGGKALAEDAAGKTQRVVIVAGLAEAIRRELARGPAGAN